MRKITLPFLRMWFSLGQAKRADTAFRTNLIIRKFTAGELVSEQHVGDGLVTDAGVKLMAADWTSASAALKLANYHDTGTGVIAPSTSDTALQIPTGETRGVGTQSNTSNTYQSTGNVTYSLNNYTVTEWGLFTASVGGTLWDHKTWSGTTVHIGDVLQFVYQLDILSGG